MNDFEIIIKDFCRENGLSVKLPYINKNVPFSRCTIFEDFSLVFRRGKQQCTNFAQSRSEGVKREEAGLLLLPLEKAYFNYSTG